MSRDTTVWRPYSRMGWGGKAASHFRGLVSSPDAPKGQVGTVVFRGSLSTTNVFITGVTRNSSGAILDNCTVNLFITGLDKVVQAVISDASGNFTFSNPGSGTFYIVAYKYGSPDVAGTTVNTLIAS